MVIASSYWETGGNTCIPTGAWCQYRRHGTLLRALVILWWVLQAHLYKAAATNQIREFLLGRDGYADLAGGNKVWWVGYRLEVNHSIAVLGMYGSPKNDIGVSLGIFKVSNSTSQIEQVLAEGVAGSGGRNQLVNFQPSVFLVPNETYIIAQGRGEEDGTGLLVREIDVQKLLNEHEAIASWEPKDGSAFLLRESSSKTPPADLIGELVSGTYSQQPDLGLRYLECLSPDKELSTNGTRCICSRDYEYAALADNPCQSCSNGSVPNANQTECVECSPNQVSGSTEASCRACPGDKVPHSTRAYCVCRRDYEVAPFEDSECRSCGNGSVPTSQQDACVTCPPGQVSGPNGSHCSSCAWGLKPDAEHSRCVVRIQYPRRTVASIFNKLQGKNAKG
eukprot:gb/GECG01015455.1/.p1 GENE.gb/GECG01015455.1/~~gb/GECG01015455.1/.p1  ORF type:complete len:393 (+),score=33.18 gb/GECG01015455.1/:1-1179(+)